MTIADIATLIGAVLTLIVLEGLLSADNALVLAVMVRHLPSAQRKKALRYGMLGAFGFRLIAVILSTSLLNFWAFKIFGGLYLLYLAIKHLIFGEGDAITEESAKGPRRSFWRTVVAVEFADIAFSIDSILAAVAMAEGLPDRLMEQRYGGVRLELIVIYIGGVLGIITMRYVAGYFIVLLDRFSGLATGAYVLVAWIGLKLTGGGIHAGLTRTPIGSGGWRDAVPEWVERLPWHMNEMVFWTGMIVIFLCSMLYRPRPKGTAAMEHIQQFTEDLSNPNSGVESNGGPAPGSDETAR